MVDKEINRLPSWTKFLWDETLIANPQPRFIEIDLTNYCNRNCTWCVSENIRKETPKNMDKQTFDAVLTHACNDNLGVVFTGGGEPTLHPHFREFCLDVIKSIKNKNIPQMGLITNGGKDFSEVKWYLENTNDPPAWVRVSVNYWVIPKELKELLKQHPNRIGISIIYDPTNMEQSTNAMANKVELETNYQPKFIRYKSCHTMVPTRDPLTCKGRKFVSIVETDGTSPYCCLARGLDGDPPKICPSGCPWNFEISDAWNYNPFS